MDDSTLQLQKYILQVSGGRSKFDRATFDLLISNVDQRVAVHGLSHEEFRAIAKALVKSDGENGNLKSMAMQKIFNILIPAGRPELHSVEKVLAWFMTYWKTMPRNAAKTVFMWLIGLLKNELIQPEDINWCYDSFFNCFDVKSINLPLCKFLELMTTPEMITKHRTKILFSKLQSVPSKGPIIHLLSLYKTLRPDKVPMQIPVTTSAFLGSSGEGRLMARMEDAAARAEVGNNPGTYSFKSISWALHRRKNSTKPILPSVTYNVKTTLKDQGVELLDCDTIKEISLNILSAKTPAQLLSLTSTPEALFFLRFQASVEVEYRFNYVLHRMFSDVETLYYEHKFEGDILDFLDCLIMKQDVDLVGSPVVTKFLNHYLSFIKHPIFLPKILKLVTRPYFTSAEDLSTKLLIPLERLFYTAVFRHKLLVIESLWTLLNNLMAEIIEGSVNDFGWEPKKTLEKISDLIAKMVSYCICTKGAIGLDDLKHSAVLHYYELCEKEMKLDRSFGLMTVAPSSLLTCCFLTGPSWLIELSSALIFNYREFVVSLPTPIKKHVGLKMQDIEEVYSTIHEILYQIENNDDDTQGYFQRALKKGVIPTISRTIIKKTPILRYFGLLPEKLTSEMDTGSEWTVEDLLEFCSNNCISFSKMLVAQNLSQHSSERS